MADIVQKQPAEKRDGISVLGGQHGFRIFSGVGAFNSTDASGTLAVPGFTKVLAYALTAADAPNTDEHLYIAANSDGSIPITSSKITIARTGTKTSGLKFSYLIIGR